MTERIKLTNDRYRLGYHIMAPSGWINDPNGFVYFKGYYHIFYQHYPNDSKWGPMHWGHARSKDLAHWETLPIALTPGDKEDEGGCFSGSAVVHDNKMYLIYTGQHYYNDGDPDHAWENQNLAISEDGVHFKKYENNPIISAPPEDNSDNFRDPKVWYDNGSWYLVIGGQTKSNFGRVLLYKSKNLTDWSYEGVLAASICPDTEGDMWECPDFFKLEGKDILLMSPQGIKRDGPKYKNFRQTGYLVGSYNFDSKQFSRGNFTELDNGHDFYATQTILTPDGRRIMFGWMDMWESKMPESEDGWAGALTLPRELTYEDGILKMKPLSELKALRKKSLYDGQLNELPKNDLIKGYKQYEAKINFDMSNTTTAGISFTDSKGGSVLKIAYDKDSKNVVLTRNSDDPEREVKIKDCHDLELHVYVDTSSIEIFINGGEHTFTERIYPDECNLNIFTSNQTNIDVKAFELENDAIIF